MWKVERWERAKEWVELSGVEGEDFGGALGGVGSWAREEKGGLEAGYCFEGDAGSECGWVLGAGGRGRRLMRTVVDGVRI